MRRLFIIITVILLSGCSLLDAYLMKYDVNEYLLISELRTLAQISSDRCSSQESGEALSKELEFKSALFSNYAQHLPYNNAVKNASLELNKIVIDLRNIYKTGNKVSPVFCKVKLKTITDSAEVMQKTIGAKPR